MWLPDVILHSMPHLVSRLALLALATPLLAASMLAAGPAFPKGEYTPASLGPKEPDLEINFPGSALAHAIPKGSAVVGILVNADGKAAYLLVVNCTDPAFGKALLDAVGSLTFAPARFKGVPVPARFHIKYQFSPPAKSIAVNAVEAATIRANSLQAPVVYAAVAESKLDQPLEFIQSAVPGLPAGYRPAGEQRVMLAVTFYVDAEGRVRAPNVESAPAPELIAPMIEAVREWTFTPPRFKGKPVLVFASRLVGFRAATP